MKSLNLFIISIIISFLYSCGSSDSSQSTKQNVSPSSHVKSTLLSSGSTNCTYGGVKVEMGIDDNMNGTLDSSEVDKTEYVCNGAPGTSGDNGTTIVWKGSLGTAPDNPVAGWSYYNSVEGKSYLYDGSNWNMIAQDGISVIDIGFVWKGTLTTEPSNPSNGWAYYNSTDNKSYIYANSAWNILTQDGLKGATGDTGATGATGATGEAGLKPSAQIACDAALQNTALYFEYKVTLFTDGSLLVHGSIYGLSVEVTDSTFYDSSQNGATNGYVNIRYDVSGSANGGDWKIALNRSTLITTVTYVDSDVTGGSLSWTLPSSSCVSNSF